ncbi:hypothetical protein GQ600_7089 [Phytophthora cactorum]|nr:hypothetical protein GQ600_7089 [Phytophthora cactorum]
MKMSVASIAVALVYFLSFVAADHVMTSDQTAPEAGSASAMTTEDLIGFLSGLATNPAVLSMLRR